MKYLLFFFIISSFIPVQAQSQKDSTNILTMTAFVSSIGIAPIPAFSLDDATCMIISNFKHRRFEFQYDYAYSLASDSFGKGWFSDMWFRYNQPMGKQTTATVGFDWSMFYQNFDIPNSGNNIHQAVRYTTYQLKLNHLFKNSWRVTSDYWYTNPIEKEYGITGSYLGLTGNKFSSYKNISMSYSTNLFGLNYDNGTKGVAIAYEVSLSHNKTGLFVGTKLMHTISVDGLPLAWNVSFGINKQLKF